MEPHRNQTRGQLGQDSTFGFCEVNSVRLFWTLQVRIRASAFENNPTKQYLNKRLHLFLGVRFRPPCLGSRVSEYRRVLRVRVVGKWVDDRRRGVLGLSGKRQRPRQQLVPHRRRSTEVRFPVGLEDLDGQQGLQDVRVLPAGAPRPRQHHRPGAGERGKVPAGWKDTYHRLAPHWKRGSLGTVRLFVIFG